MSLRRVIGEAEARGVIKTAGGLMRGREEVDDAFSHRRTVLASFAPERPFGHCA